MKILKIMNTLMKKIDSNLRFITLLVFMPIGYTIFQIDKLCMKFIKYLTEDEC